MNQAELALGPIEPPTCWVRSISLWQPWASLMAVGAKTVETRGWGTSIRGKVFIHASKTRQGLQDARLSGADCIAAMEAALGVPHARWEVDLPFGCIVASGRLVSSIPAPIALESFPSQHFFGNFAEGRWGHLYEGLTRVESIPCRGAQGFFFSALPKGAGKFENDSCKDCGAPVAVHDLKTAECPFPDPVMGMSWWND